MIYTTASCDAPGCDTTVVLKCSPDRVEYELEHNERWRITDYLDLCPIHPKSIEWA